MSSSQQELTMPDAGNDVLARTARGAGWVMAWRLATRVIGLASTLVLVRLLLPDDFGLVSLATALALALDAALDFGVEDQIVRAREPTRALYDTAWTLNLVRAVLIAAMLAAGARWAAGFFGDARLEEVLYALAVSALGSGFVNIGTVEFRRSLLFHREFQLLILPRIASSLVTIGLAFVLRSHWALVCGILTGRISSVALGYMVHPYRPRPSLREWRQLAGISAWAWVLAVISLVRNRADSLVVGRMLGPASVGLYAIAYEIATLAATELIEPLGRACMPGFSEALRNGTAIRESYVRIIGFMALLTLPVGIGTSLVAGPVVALAFGQAWTAAVPLIQVLGIASVLLLFAGVSSNLLDAHARLRTMSGIAGGFTVVRVAALLLLTSQFGLLGAALAVALAFAVECILYVRAALSILGLPAAQVGLAVWRPVCASGAMCALLWLGGLGWTPAPASAAVAVADLAGAVLLGAACYAMALLSLWVLSGRPAGAEADLLRVVRSALPGRRST